MQRVGPWDVTETVWASPDAALVTNRGLLAERPFMGMLIKEVIRPPGESLENTGKRTDLLSYNRLEGDSTINLTFIPCAVPSLGAVSAHWSADKGMSGPSKSTREGEAPCLQ